MRGYGQTGHHQHVSCDTDHISKYTNIRASKYELPTTVFIYFGALGQR